MSKRNNHMLKKIGQHFSRFRKSPQRWFDYLWLILGALWLAGLGLGYTGFAQHAAAVGEDLSGLDLIYLTLQLIPMNSGYVAHPVNWELEVARLLIPLVAASTAVQALASLFRQQMAFIGLRFTSGHVIICGLSRKGFLLVENFRQAGERVVVIEHREHNDWIEPSRLLGAIVLMGDATDTGLLSKAGLGRARCVISVVDDDGINAEVAVRAQALTANRSGNPLTCIIHIVNPQLCSLLREREIGKDHNPTMRLELFNVFERGAHILLHEHPLQNRTDGSAPHWLVIGLGGMGESLVMQAAREWHNLFPNNSTQMRFTIIDQVAHTRIAALKYHYPRLEKVCQLTALDMEIHSPEFLRGEYLFDAAGDYDVDAIFICLDDDSLGLHAGLSLEQRLRQTSIPIVLRMAEKGGLATLLQRPADGAGYYANLSAFALLDRTCTPDLLLGGTHEILAQALHEEYLRHQQNTGIQIGSKPAMVAWEALSEPIKEDNRRQVDRIGLKLEAVGCTLAPIADWEAAQFKFSAHDVDKLARMEHDQWRQDYEQRNTQSIAKKIKRGAQSHPDMIAWELLPETEKEKNRTSVRELPSFLARAGFQINRNL